MNKFKTPLVFDKDGFVFSSEQEAKKACQAHYDALWISGGEEV